MSTLYLAKANNELVCHCECDVALATFPPQMDCPWCGCGWLFTCITCRKAFTFAKAVVVPESLEELARRDLEGMLQEEPGEEHIQEWLGIMRELLEDVEEGEEYVYLDGFFVPTSVGEAEIIGWHSHHVLDFIPQVEAMNDDRILDNMLANQDYWFETAIGDEDQEDEEDDDIEDDDDDESGDQVDDDDIEEDRR